MKTLIIFDDGTIEPKYLILDGDFSRFHNQYIGCSTVPPEVEKEMLAFFYADSGDLKEHLTTMKEPLHLRLADQIKVVVCGQLL